MSTFVLQVPFGQWPLKTNPLDSQTCANETMASTPTRMLAKSTGRMSKTNLENNEMEAANMAYKSQNMTYKPPVFWGCAKGAAKGSCGETVVQKGVFGESVSSLLP